MSAIPHSVIALAETLERRWKQYLHHGVFDSFVEFTLSLNGLTEQLDRLQLPGLVRACQELENLALTLFGDENSHPIGQDDSNSIQRQLSLILREFHRHETPAVSHRHSDASDDGSASAWNRPRDVLIVARTGHPWCASLSEQLTFFGFRPHEIRWEETAPADLTPLAVVFVPEREGMAYPDEAISTVRLLRAEFSASYFYCLSVPSILEPIVHLQRAGADACVPASDKVSDVLSRILDLVQTKEQTVPRVLVVEDSATAVAHIRRSLSQHGIDSRAIGDPRFLLEAANDYHPDLILMDMYMPFCTGVEVTRALRQIPEYQSLPVVYLSSESDVAQQVEALRLGGDQFLTKPVNPIVLSAVVKTKIERYRDMMRSGRHDSLTGLLNHTAAKNKLDTMARTAHPAGLLTVAMIDIDRFKSINDNWGHPVGDQVIRSLAWLLRGRLRSSDLIGRYGGEEFLVALPGADREQALALLDRIREDFATLPHAHSQGVLRATFSCGVASMPEYNTSTNLIEAADNALLECKRRGRNCIISAPPPGMDFNAEGDLPPLELAANLR